MCFSTPFSSVHEFLRNQSSASEPTSEAASQEQTVVRTNAREQPDLMMSDMPMVEVSTFDEPDDDDDDLFDDDMGDLGDLDDDDVDVDDDVSDEDDDVSSRRRPHRGGKGHRGRRIERRMRHLQRKCCKAGREEGLSVESDEAPVACGAAAKVYSRNEQPRIMCIKFYKKCCNRAGMADGI